MLRAIDEHRINLAFSIGMMWNAVVEQDLESYDLSSLELIGTCTSTTGNAAATWSVPTRMGYLYFVDRLKDMVKTGDLNVFTVEVEQVIIGHRRSPSWQSRGFRTSSGAKRSSPSSPGPATPNSMPLLEAHCRTQLAGYKVPKLRLRRLHSIELAGLGVKRALVDELVEGSTEH